MAVDYHEWNPFPDISTLSKHHIWHSIHPVFLPYTHKQAHQSLSDLVVCVPVCIELTSTRINQSFVYFVVCSTAFYKSVSACKMYVQMYSIVYNPLVLLYCNLPKGSQALMITESCNAFFGNEIKCYFFALSLDYTRVIVMYLFSPCHMLIMKSENAVCL